MTREEIKQRFRIVGDSPELNRAIDIAIRVAETEVTVLVVGENGVGKDIFSKIIHQLSFRKHKPFIAINAGAIPEGTIDSELFGHEKGSFTSAYDSRKGYFEEVNGGVIFLDEIAELPINTQARLLRVLESGEYLRVGSSKVQKTDVRVIAATNKNLIDAIRKGKFREDLYFRLNTVTIYVPPLRERGRDIEKLFHYFCRVFGEKYNKAPIELTPEGVRMLHEYHWPGNVRELRNFAEKVTVLAVRTVLDGADLQQFLPQRSRGLTILPPSETAGDTLHEDGQSGSKKNNLGEISPELFYRVMYDLKQEIGEIKFAIANLSQLIARGGVGMPTQPMPGFYPQLGPKASQEVQQYRLPDEDRFADGQEKKAEESLSIEEKEQDLIEKALIRHNKNRKKAAQELGISERTLYRKIKSYGLE